MRVIDLDIEKMKTRSALHKYLQNILALPDHYGKNLDALYDCLSEIAEETELVVPISVAENNRLGDYGSRFLLVLHDAAESNKFLHIKKK